MSGLLDRFRLDGQVAVITGGAGGLGKAAAALFVEAGASVVITDRDGAAAEAAAKAIGGACRPAVLDVTDEADVARVVDGIVAADGRIDVLLNNAGIAIRRPTTELSLDDWNRVLAVNLTGMFLSARAAARHMIAAGSGAIVNTASIMGLSGGGLYPNISYQATKGAVVNMTRALAVEWAPHGIRVNAVAPTWVRTDLVLGLIAQPGLQEAMERVMPLRRLAEPEEVALAMLYLASPAAGMTTGHILAVDGGFLAQ